MIVRVPAVGGGFGGKLHAGICPHAAALCLAARLPVRLVCRREDELQASNPREPSIVSMSSRISASGAVVHRRADILLDSGAYDLDTPGLAATAALQACGPYDVSSLDVEARIASSNTSPTGSFRAPTGPQMVFAYETHLHDIAVRLGVDRHELRQRLLVGDGSLGPTGQRYDHPAIDEAVAAIRERIEDWQNDADVPARDTVRGYGIACAVWNTCPFPSDATLRLDQDGTATLLTGAVEIGTGAVASGLAMVVARELGISPAAVRLHTGSTELPYDAGSEGSRTLYGAGAAATAAARAVRAQLLAVVAEQFEANPADLVFEAGRIGVAGSPTRSMTIGAAAELACRRSGADVVGNGSYELELTEHRAELISGCGFTVIHEPTFHCHGAEVDLNVRNGSIRVRRYAAAHDVGVVIDADGVHGQIEGGVVQGLGQALYENVQIDRDGVVVNNSFVDYRLPTTLDFPTAST